MARFILAQLYRRSGRAVALLLSLLVATTGFTVLTGSATTSRLIVTGTVNSNYRGAYDILVRPAGSRTPLEEQRGLLRPNFLGGQYGGITVDQWRRIEATRGVEVAAPIAMLGYATTTGVVEIDLTAAVDRSVTRQLLRVVPTWVADRGLTSAPDDSPAYIYVTRRPVVWPVLGELDSHGGWPFVGYEDGMPHQPDACGKGAEWPPYEIQEDGRALPLCLSAAGDALAGRYTSENPAPPRIYSEIVELTPAGQFRRQRPSDRLTLRMNIPLALLAAAIDPAAEAALVGLDRAVTSGRYLSADEPPVGEMSAPALFADEAVLDERLDVTAELLTGAEAIAGQQMATLLRELPVAATTGSARVAQPSAQDSYRNWLAPTGSGGPGPAATVQFGLALQPGHVDYQTMRDGVLRARPQQPAAEAWELPWQEGQWPMPPLAHDTAFRPTLAPHRVSDVAGRLTDGLEIGTFDSARLTAYGGLSRVPLETYVPPAATGADAATRDRLGGAPLLPNSNPGGYLTTPPTVLIAMRTLLRASNVPAPISAVRVRVSGLTGFDKLSRERVRVVADEIAAATDLDVEVVLGSSPSGQEVTLPAGAFGRPELHLTEEWARKGVAALIVRAVDRKSTVLFGLILAVCVLFLANALAAAVRDRRRELAVLACLGWPRWRLAGLVLGDVTVIALVAGAVSAMLAVPLGRAVGSAVPSAQVWLAPPVAVGLALLAAVVPAWRASRAHPAQAMHPAVSRVRTRRIRRRRTLLGLSAANLRRVPGRTALGAIALAIGVAGMTLVAAVTTAFHGTVTGSLLGDAVSIRVRGVDTVAVLATLLLGLFGIADVLYLNVRERGAELAALRATGWSEWSLGRLVAYEGLGIGLIGSIAGAAAGLAGATWFAGVTPSGLFAAAAAAAAGGIALAGLAAIVPAVLQRRISTSTLLAEE